MILLSKPLSLAGPLTSMVLANAGALSAARGAEWPPAMRQQTSREGCARATRLFGGAGMEAAPVRVLPCDPIRDGRRRSER